MPNTQPPEPPVKGDGLTLDLHSVFLTLQGEGPFSGRRAVFVRLAGCGLQCPGCDTEYTQGREELPVEMIINRVRRAAIPMADTDALIHDGLVVITGGEPLRQPIGNFVNTLIRIGYRVQIESNGTTAPDSTLYSLLMDQPELVKLVVSPKTKNIHPICYQRAAAFKYVLDYRSVDVGDGLPEYALEHTRGGRVARPRPGAPVYLTPYDAGVDGNGQENEIDNQQNRNAVAHSCIKHGYIANLQIHKLLGLA